MKPVKPVVPKPEVEPVKPVVPKPEVAQIKPELQEPKAVPTKKTPEALKPKGNVMNTLFF